MTPDPELSYNQVIEVLDHKSILPGHLYDLALWMSEYYRVSMGIILFAMLPVMLVPDVDATIRWTADHVPEGLQSLHDLLADGQMHTLSQLRKDSKSLSIYRLVEDAASLQLIEMDRKLNRKDKPVIANYLICPDSSVDLASLGPRQREAMQVIIANAGEMAMAELAQTMSYSIIKALVSKGMLRVEPRVMNRRAQMPNSELSPKGLLLTPEQEKAIEGIYDCHGRFGVNLLYGITGSGKTEVYIRIIERYLEDGKNVIFLIPEIALTPQMVERFQCEFGPILAISHSRLTDRERLDQWQKIASGECRIVVGARSAIFAPLPNIGLIIVDEEHEQTYKQDNNPRYHGRDVAVVRAKMVDAQVILGSATPALESWNNVETGKYRRQTILSRPPEVQLPRVDIVDMRDEEGNELLSNTLLNAITERLDKKEQVILFQNRRGYASYMQCLKCGELISCGNCEVSMYYHRDKEEMQCHYCGFKTPSPRKCPKCGSFSFSYGAPGTQKIEQILQLCFPGARMLRLDSDTAKQRDAHKTMYERMKKRDVDILLGTQMITKGLDFPGVTMVGIIMADISLNVPDFRAAERTFQHLTQVAGRSGRGDKPGQVVIQTYNPEHYAIQHAADQNYPAFAAEEMSYRKRLLYPPYYKLARIVYQSKSSELLQNTMDAIAKVLQENPLSVNLPSTITLGPVPAPFAKLNNMFRHHIIVKGPTTREIHKALSVLVQIVKLPSTIQCQIDVDPMTLM